MKIADHPHDRLHERTNLSDAELDRLIALVREKKDLVAGQTYFHEWPGRGYAVIAPTERRKDLHVVKTVLSPKMRPPGRRLPREKTANAVLWQAFEDELGLLEKDAGLEKVLPSLRRAATTAGKGATQLYRDAQLAAATSPTYHRLLMNPTTPANMVGFLESPASEVGERVVRGTLENALTRRRLAAGFSL